MRQDPLFPGYVKKAKKNGFSAWRKKELSKWKANDFYGYFWAQLKERNREVVTPKEVALRHFRELIERFTGTFPERGKEALKDMVDQCMLDPRCVGTGFLLRQAESFVVAQGWKYRKPEHEEL